jgi:hypothetical protein
VRTGAWVDFGEGFGEVVGYGFGGGECESSGLDRHGAVAACGSDEFLDAPVSATPPFNPAVTLEIAELIPSLTDFIAPASPPPDAVPVPPTWPGSTLLPPLVTLVEVVVVKLGLTTGVLGIGSPWPASGATVCDPVSDTPAAVGDATAVPVTPFCWTPPPGATEAAFMVNVRPEFGINEGIDVAEVEGNDVAAGEGVVIIGGGPVNNWQNPHSVPATNGL